MTDVKDRLDIRDLTRQLRDSPFNKTSYIVDISLSNFLNGVSMFTHGDERGIYGDYDSGFKLDEEPDRLFECVPPFQRNNDKWSQQMQIKFIENILKGCKTTLMFYEISSDLNDPARTNCMILDGLQRLTALHAFITGKFTVFGYTYHELVSFPAMRMNLLTIKLSDYTFLTEIDAVEFYIAMNENITHSPSDIQRAKDYLAQLRAQV